MVTRTTDDASIGPSSTTSQYASSSSTNLLGSASTLHVTPHGAHVHPGSAGPSTGAVIDPEEHEYEALPLGSGWAVNMAAGAMAGISEHSVIFPIDSIKTRMQILPSTASSLLATATSSTSSASSSSSSTPRPALPHRPHHTLPQVATIGQHLRLVSTTDGLRSLWRGVASVIMGAGPAHAAHFGMYEFVREISGGRGEGWWGVGGTALAGAAATISSDALMNPFDVIKQRMQVQNSPYRSVISCAKSVYTTEGLAAFYVSYPTTLTMSVPFTAVQFSVYESLKSLLNPDGSYSPLTHVTAGGFAGAVAAAVTTPLDVAKTLLQTRGSSSDPQIRQARGMLEALRLIRERDGVKGLRRGWIPRVLTVAPSTAISWMSYEFFKVLIRQRGTLPETGQAL
ncbi:carrier [Kockovaella imperatae]|uniref:Carrier n=1 Tax=Kockovaella imperatae TaxID=4999 RepID=A0A1Y1UIZ1_9TREE|nr:carrier [Kockovaella imperatae]ORX38028.1 carrier [Kockovaella imperatae]